MKNIALPLASALLVLSANPMMGRAAATPASVQQKPETQSKIFSGTILKNGDTYVLSDAGTKTSYVLDDAQKASPYEGKKVKVTGTVDVASNTIHVETIQEIA
ncbi:MAG: hypothetical protein JWN92_2347 [Candidatus Acidoferrum typicum]|jgi:hypothetical protein|nr:hypothetical protein [Candidatus Acidoferrum typicum]